MGLPDHLILFRSMFSCATKSPDIADHSAKSLADDPVWLAEEGKEDTAVEAARNRFDLFGDQLDRSF